MIIKPAPDELLCHRLAGFITNCLLFPCQQNFSFQTDVCRGGADEQFYFTRFYYKFVLSFIPVCKVFFGNVENHFLDFTGRNGYTAESAQLLQGAFNL